MLTAALASPVADAIDIALVAVLVFAAIVWIRDARAHLALLGIGILLGVYLVARQVGLQLFAWIFQGFFAVSLVLLVVMFQEEFRQVFERIAVWGLRRRGGAPAAPDTTEAIARTASDLAAVKRGALIVLPGRDPIERHIEGGIPLRGEVSEPLLLSLFDPNSPGHDGAVVIDGSRVRLFAAHLPLSADFSQLRRRGTRHAAALGLAERTDAICIVVSEERGRISVARAGRLVELRQPEELTRVLHEVVTRPVAVDGGRARSLRFVRANWKEGLLAVVLSLALWVLVVPGSKTSELTVRVPVVVQQLPVGYALESIDPPEVDAVVSGLWRDLVFSKPGRLEVALDPFLVQMGRRTFEVSPGSVRHPPEITVTAVQPDKVKLSLRKLQPGEFPSPVGTSGAEAAERR